ncbi:DUF4097 family beta strand repeat-containing protein [Salinicoccus halodurans]|uniref:DUF4097 and DUF4098 domain-containing protein YvlB n=1 Tax=Salinicoccus halodurans TaxID=407035 RepID=A0A0F7HIT3_9STAP|nr:DUF4097 family beta strand repeat-containing protein [Salinicoccus halodurans]AKG73222.1 hypothetical protein AAT16_02690 [Salinicoccus halodurans]SFK83793.1 DUF4097 and DUF4098 domain-containing protein YvlB [Salinicoccus halodurans]
MDNKDRILKMLEEGKITSEEAIRLMEAMESKESDASESKRSSHSDEQNRQQNRHSQQERQSGKSSGNFAGAGEAWDQFVGEFQKIVNPEKANETYSNVKSKFENQKYASQVFGSLEKAFDSVKNSNIDSMFSAGAKNRLIETIDEDFSNISVDITNGNVVIVPTDRVTTAKFEVTSFYRKLDKKRNYFQDIICEVKNGELMIVSDIRTARVNVELQVNPSIVNRLIVSSSNGNVTIENEELSDLTVDILNGNITLENVSANSAFTRTSRGNITVGGGGYGALELISMVGTVNTDRLNAKDLTVSSNGSVNLSLKEETESASINTNMGSINISVPQGRALEGRISTVVGQLNYPPDINVRFMKQQDIGLKELMLVNDTDERGLILEVGTKFGSVTLHRH